MFASLLCNKGEYIPKLREGICQLLLQNITLQKITLVNHSWHWSLKKRDVNQRWHINEKERDNEFSEISKLSSFWMKSTFNVNLKSVIIFLPTISVLLERYCQMEEEKMTIWLRQNQGFLKNNWKNVGSASPTARVVVLWGDFGFLHRQESHKVEQN